MIKKITLIIAVFAVQLLPAQVKWSNTNFFEQKNFIENKGQFESSSIPNGENILFLAKIDGVQYFFTNTGYTIARKELVKKTKADKEREDKHHWNSKGEEDEEENRYKFNETFQELNFVGANPTPSVETAHQVTNYYSYQDAKSPQRKGTIIAHAYPKITYKNMYPNIDVVFEFPKDSAGIEYSFIVHPGGDVENIKMAFPKNKELKIINNTIEIESAFGKIIHHQPTSFVENKKTKVNSSFVMKGNKVGFELGTYDKTKTLTIDPWTSVPSFAGASCAFDVDYDLIGNAYAYGGTGPFELVKFNTSGTLLWTFTAAFLGGFYYYGDFAVDRNTSNVYLTEGFNNAAGAGVVKISPGATVLATFGGNAQFNEMWRIAFSRCTNNAVIAGGGVSSPTYQTCFLDTNLLGITPVQYVVTGNCCHDVGLLALDNYGNSYQVTNQRVGDPIFDNTLVKLPLPAMLPITYSVSTNYAFREAASVQYYSTGGTAIANGYNGLTTSTTFVYTYDGYVLKKWDGPTGNLLVYHRMSFPPANDSSVMSWGGISADDCGNLFLGDNTNVRQFDANLTLVNTYPMTGTITDVQIANSGTLYVSGLGFVTTLTPTNIVNCQNSGVLALTATTVPATCNAPGSATAVVTGGNPPYNVVWNTNPPQFGLTISGVPPGTYTCTIQDGGCNQTTFIDSVTILSVGGVAATTSTTICTCGNNNGTATCTPTQGAPPYTYAWNNGQTTQTATGLAVGIYTCVITDSQGCTSTETLNVTSNNAVTLAYTATQTGCTTSTGTATITPTGGTLPYTYLWQNGQTTQTGTGFAIGTFSCVVTDGAGCAQLEYVNITATNPVLLSISSTPTGCTTSIGTATAIPSNGATGKQHQQQQH